MEHVHEPVTTQDGELVGLLAYSALAAMTRLAKDGDQAPTILAHVEHARMSSAAFGVFEQLEKWSDARGLDLLEVAGRYSGLFDDLDARTRPTTWRERSVKTYVTVGIFADLLREVVRRRELFGGSIDDWHFGQQAWVLQHLAPELASDEEGAARLSLWARRVAGEALGLVRSTLFTHPHLVSDPDAVDEIVAHVTARHGERMAAIHLRA
ncbi:ferritin-like fold-containing protein [Schaalia suimastitidis]|uniref:ferritin-like fold-containing protein n=1 Tax=Schaalia suimastitidis TaxID=121163 RepID=UPI0003FFD849|nr:ferritin-like fold-containing protein [Schaalia suimastitidis]